MLKGKFYSVKPWERLNMSRKHYSMLKPWKKAKMDRKQFEEILLLVPDELIAQARTESEAERLINAMFGQQK
ncbi:MAG: hypothetical protein ACOCUV_03220 [bacterium]